MYSLNEEDTDSFNFKLSTESIDTVELVKQAQRGGSKHSCLKNF
jgi:hypothetical protein